MYHLKENFAKFLLLLHDISVSFCILCLAIYLKGVFGRFNLFFIKPNSNGYLNKIWWVSLFLIFIFLVKGLYSKRLSFWDEAKEMFISGFFTVILSFSVIYLTKKAEFPRSILFFYFVFVVVILPVTRHYFKIILTKIGLYKNNILIIGANEAGKTVAKGLLDDEELGFNIVGFLDDNVVQNVKVNGHQYNVLGKVRQVEDIIKNYAIDAVVVALPDLRGEDLESLVANVQKLVRKLFLVPKMKNVAISNTELYHLFDEQMFLLKIHNNLQYLRNRFLKRLFDLFLAIILIPILFPIILFIAILIRLDSKGSPFFVQDRIGQNNKKFKFIKFRSMYINGDEMLKDYLKKNPKAKDEWERYKKLKSGDPRVTRIGKFLRKTSLDELPQIFNVLKGEMSFVGPRPYLPREEEEMGTYKDYILLTKPGITGLWQISGRNNLEFEDRLKLDTWYVLNWSLWLDIVILFKTIKVVLKREGAY